MSCRRDLRALSESFAQRFNTLEYVAGIRIERLEMELKKDKERISKLEEATGEAIVKLEEYLNGAKSRILKLEKNKIENWLNDALDGVTEEKDDGQNKMEEMRKEMDAAKMKISALEENRREDWLSDACKVVTEEKDESVMSQQCKHMYKLIRDATKIEALNLPNRVMKNLKEVGILTLGDLMRTGPIELFNLLIKRRTAENKRNRPAGSHSEVSDTNYEVNSIKEALRVNTGLVLEKEK